MTHYNKLRLGIFIAISLLIILSVIFIGYFGLSSLDKAKANNYYNNEDSISVGFPFTEINSIVNFNSINFMYSSYTNSSDYRVTTGDYYYTILGGKRNYTGWAYSSYATQTINGITIPFVYTYCQNSTALNAIYQQGCYGTYSAGTTYYINFAFNTGCTCSGPNNPLFYFINSSNTWIDLGITYNSIINNSDYKSYNGYVYCSIPYTPSQNFNRFIFNIRFTDLEYYCTLTTTPSFNSSGFFSYDYSATYDGNSYLEDYIALNSIFGGKDALYYSNLFNSIDNNNISIFLTAKFGSSTSYGFNINNLTLTTDTLNNQCYTSTTYDLTNTYKVTIYLYKYSDNYGYNTLEYYFYNSSGNSISTLTDIYIRFSFANNRVDNYQIGYLAGFADGNNISTSTYYNAGYSAGYNDGLDTAENGSFFNLMSSVIEAPLQAILNIFDFEILGYNMKSFYLALLTLALVLFCIKFITGNSKNE